MVLGKRGMQYRPNRLSSLPKSKRRYQPTDYGKGYNPKQAIGKRKPPPGAEHKYHEVGADATTLQNASSGTFPAHSGFPSLIDIDQGDAMKNRNGNKIMIDKINIRGRCIMDPNQDADVTNVVYATGLFRVILYIDTQCNGAGVTSDVFFDTELVNQDAFDCYNNLFNTGRFKILMDKRITVVPQPCFMNTTETPDTILCAGGEVEFSKTIKNLSIPVFYSSAQGDIQHIRTNNIGMWVLQVGGGGSNVATNVHRKFAYRFRCRYYDN